MWCLKISHAKLHEIAHKMLNFNALNHIKAGVAKENPSLLNWTLQNLVHYKLADRKIAGKNFASYSNHTSNHE